MSEMGLIDYIKVIAYSKAKCHKESQGRCAEYVKKAFQAGGCKYISGDGWNNQSWCKKNGFKCIGEFTPVDKNPRAHNGIPIQFPEGYVQQVGDVCLIKHGTYGHMCYAMGTNINDWVSDYFQRPPVQKDGTGPYCYDDNKYEKIQFWRNDSSNSNSVQINTSDYEPVSNYVTDNKPNTVSTGYDAADGIVMGANGKVTLTPTINNNTTKKSSKKGTVVGTHVRQKSADSIKKVGTIGNDGLPHTYDKN